MTKIQALEKTIYNLENKVYKYSWGGCDTCSCGVLAQTMLNDYERPTDTLFAFGPGNGFSGTYKDGLQHCEKTGIELPRVMQVLKETGFTVQEMIELENLCTKDDVVKYMKALVEKLSNGQEVQEGDATKLSKETEAGTKIIHHYHKVTVPESIETKELILS